eukprot:Skav209875  [mRNA]  locus=scaffold590:203395:206039:+ [translate_table: standard]
MAAPSMIKQKQLREHLRVLGVRSRFRLPNTSRQCCLSDCEMESVLQRYEMQRRGNLRLRAAMDREKSRTNLDFQLACAFWHNVDGENYLPQVSVDGLHSAVQVGYKVKLATYQKLRNIPSGVQVIPAEEILSAEKFAELQALGVHITHIAEPWWREGGNGAEAPVDAKDYVRFLMIRLVGGAWFLDCDVLHLRPGPTPTAEQSFHIFASMRARANSTRQGYEAEWRKWQIQYLREPQDRLYLASPYFVPGHLGWSDGHGENSWLMANHLLPGIVSSEIGWRLAFVFDVGLFKQSIGHPETGISPLRMIKNDCFDLLE